MAKEGGTTNLFGPGVPPDPGDVLGIIERASDIAVYLSDDLLVEGISVNPECPSLGCLDHWVGRSFEQFLTDESKEKLRLRLADLKDSADEFQRPVELNHVDSTKWESPVRYSIHRIHGSSFLLVGRDMQPIAEVQQKLLAEQHARERDIQALRGEETFYRVVLNASETALVLVDAEQGRIRDLNGSAAVLLGSKAQTLTGSAFAQAFEGRRRGEFVTALQSAADTDEAQGIVATARRNGRTVEIYPESFRAAGKLYYSCRMNVVAEKDDATPQMSNSLMALFATTSDAIVLTDLKGDIREANEAFLIMADAAQLRDLRDTALSDYLARGMVDMKLILESAQKRERLRGYSTQLVSLVGTRLNVEISAAKLRNKVGDLGFGLIIRDSQPSDASSTGATAAAVSEDSMKNVMALVGTASLKQLVSATSDVVEKMCIETAVQLTGNNRMAAAEMLGLSRQSLYVKLRKHGLIQTSGDEDDDGKD